MRRQSAEDDAQQRDEESRRGDALNHRGDGIFPIAVARGELRAHIEHDGEHQEGKRGDPARIEHGQIAPDNGRENQREQAHPGQHLARVGGGVADELLQPQRQQHQAAEEHAVGQRQQDGADGEGRDLEQGEIDHRMLVVDFPDQEQHETHYGRGGQRDDDRAGEPVEFLPLVEHDLQRAYPDDQQPQSGPVDRQLADGCFASQVDRRRDRRGQQTHGHVDIENPRPGDVIGDPAAEQRPHDGGD